MVSGVSDLSRQKRESSNEKPVASKRFWWFTTQRPCDCPPARPCHCPPVNQRVYCPTNKPPKVCPTIKTPQACPTSKPPELCPTPEPVDLDDDFIEECCREQDSDEMDFEPLMVKSSSVRDGSSSTRLPTKSHRTTAKSCKEWQLALWGKCL